ncbi:CpsB/CapC family capsule biosynthesis tyrosine phosphatase [Bilifractor sp. HCP3S3_D3]|uniref:CpsB/CapC family capsule biosynthesis tyrosine phosphatase n=1 Tax=Bilifractor sp. HCP3S3_D3 TaxID=3438907 RepID=UPI003F8B7577
MLFRQEKKPFYDLHLHILPGMDDGARDLQMSAGMLREEIRQGCEGLIATPHYYPTESISDFLARRKRAFDELQGWIEEELPDWEGRIGLGAEAAYHNGLVCDPDLEKLCMGHSRYLLLEMPFEKWTSGVLRDVRVLIANGIRPVIAHLERFPEYAGEDAIGELLEMDVLIQMNAGALLHRSSRRRAVTMVRNGITQILGTDSHNLDSRCPNMKDGLEILRKEHLGRQSDEILENNAAIYQAAME